MATKNKIVIVEDNVDLCNLYKQKLENEGFDVRAAFNGAEGLKVVKHFEPDLVLLDLMMPVMGGAEMLKKMRGEEWGSKPYVMILTNLNKSEAPSELRFFNVERYIVKAHFTLNQVVQIVKELLR